MTLQERKISANVKDIDLVKQKREEIIRAASKVFIEKGFHQATIRDICKATGFGPGTLYNYIKKKEDILYLVYNKLTMMLTECLVGAINNGERDPSAQFKEALTKKIDIIWDYQDLILLMYQETASLDKESRHNILKRESDFVGLFRTILERDEEKRVVKNKGNAMGPDIIAYLLAFIPLRRWNLKQRFNENEIKRGLINFILSALGMDTACY